jgi:pyruvate,water dikinase
MANAFDHSPTNSRVSDAGSTPVSLPPELYDELVQAYRRLGEYCGVDAPSVAVRSSALDEDGAGASFAGQHETYLNVVGADAVAEAVARCRASVHSSRALEYRRRRGLPLDEVRIAVLVQQLIPADVSSVVFSANPVTGSRNELMINANWGLGESIVSGAVTPDTYVVRKADLTIVSSQIAEKRQMTVTIPGGTREVDVPRVLRAQPTLKDDQVVEMARLGVALERRMGHRVDMECAIHAGQLYLLQCRPITTHTGMRGGPGSSIRA